MLFNYKALDATGGEKIGAIDAINVDVAISSLQRRGLIISAIRGADEKGSLLTRNFSMFERVKVKDVVILSRQMATLFEAQVSALRIFRLLSAENESRILKTKLATISDDLQAGSSISAALAKHPKIFSEFYVSMVKAGEESGKLDETFNYLADYLDRTYELTSKAKNALIYPGFVIFTFFTVMILMFTVVIPKIAGILIESGQGLPIYTQIVLSISNVLVNYGIIVAIIALIVGFFVVRYIRTPQGTYVFDDLKLRVPYFSSLYKKLYLSRLADNMNTMLASGIPMIRALELTSSVVDNVVFKALIDGASADVKGGKPISEALGKSNQIPGIMVQMMKVGEETGELGSILKTLAHFYSREVITAVDTLVDLIEPLMIVTLGLGVAFLLASVLIPIYNIAGAQ